MERFLTPERNPIVPSCELHAFDTASGTCRLCRRSFCEPCLVYPFGAHEDPLCIKCAMKMAGVRSRGRSRLR